MLRRVVGGVLIVVGVIGIVLSLGTLAKVSGLASTANERTRSVLIQTEHIAASLKEAAAVTSTALDEFEESLAAAEEASDSASATLREASPLVDEVADALSTDLPEGLEEFELAIPEVAEAAGVIDKAMRTLDSFNYDRSFLGVPLRFSLGVHYDPLVPFDVTIERLGESMEGIPEDMRSIASQLRSTGTSLDDLQGDMAGLSEGLSNSKGALADAQPLLEKTGEQLQEAIDMVIQLREDLDGQAIRAGRWISLLIVVFALNQLAPIAVGVLLLKGRNGPW